MSLRQSVACDVPGCAVPVAMKSRFVSINLSALTSEFALAEPYECVHLHVCEQCSKTREGRAFVVAQLEAYAAKVKRS